MPRQATPRGWAKARSSADVRLVLATAFVHALTAVQASHGIAARWLGVTRRTVGRWARAEGALDLELLGTSKQLWPHFLRCLTVLERKARRV